MNRIRLVIIFWLVNLVPWIIAVATHGLPPMSMTLLIFLALQAVLALACIQFVRSPN